VIVVLVLVICYSALFYALVHTRASRSRTDGPPLFSAVVSELGERRAGLSSKPYAVLEDQTTDPPRHWRFRPIDVWPNPPGWSSTLSEFTPVTDAQPDATVHQIQGPSGKPSGRRPALRMVCWLRPDYPAEWARTGQEGRVLLDLRIAPGGQASEVSVTQSSGSRTLDESAARAARHWRFAPPLWNARPVEVWAQVEIRYHRFGDRRVSSDAVQHSRDRRLRSLSNGFAGADGK
jgi:TonB family protein